jgi:hypothetical protein
MSPARNFKLRIAHDGVREALARDARPYDELITSWPAIVEQSREGAVKRDHRGFL